MKYIPSFRTVIQIAIAILVASGVIYLVYFLGSLNAQVRQNTDNINVIGEFLQKATQPAQHGTTTVR